MAVNLIAAVLDDPGRPSARLALLMWAPELASAARPDEYHGDLSAGLGSCVIDQCTPGRLLRRSLQREALASAFRL